METAERCGRCGPQAQLVLWEERRLGPAPPPAEGESAGRWLRRCLAAGGLAGTETEVAVADSEGLRLLPALSTGSPPAQRLLRHLSDRSPNPNLILIPRSIVHQIKLI